MKKIITHCFLSVVIMLLGISSFACAAKSGNTVEREPARNLSTSVDEFCWKYFGTLNRKENIFYSPYGINSALSILTNGASGNTRKEILNALSADNVENLNDEHKRFSALVAEKYRGDNIFMESNLLLIDKSVIGHGIDKNFKRVVIDVYNSDVREANFSGNVEGEKQKISRWVSDKTNGFIPDYKSIVMDTTLTDLLNVVYFKGKWAMPFKAENTLQHEFKNLDGSTSKIKMMNEVFKDAIKYHEDDKFKAIALPYSENAAMYLIMPTKDDDLNIAEEWNNESLAYRADFLKGLRNSSAFDGEVIVGLPKFELDIENNLIENLKAIGIKKSFTGAAEFFDVINGTSLKIDDAKHRAKVKVDELGTEAAAITEIALSKACAPVDEPRRVYFIAKRPFLFVIRDVESNIALFAGVVNKL